MEVDRELIQRVGNRIGHFGIGFISGRCDDICNIALRVEKGQNVLCGNEDWETCMDWVRNGRVAGKGVRKSRMDRMVAFMNICRWECGTSGP